MLSPLKGKELADGLTYVWAIEGKAQPPTEPNAEKIEKDPRAVVLEGDSAVGSRCSGIQCTWQQDTATLWWDW